MWRIFRKDCRQLWRLAAIVACAQMTNAALRLVLGPFNQPRGLVTFAEVFSAATLLGTCALIVAAVHEDVVPGASQDWLVRPIRRRDLLAAKLLFVVVIAQGPACLADMAHGILAGLSVSESVGAALSRSTVMLLVFDVPVLGLASITSTLVQVMGSVIGIWLAVMVGVFAGIIARGGAPPPFASSGIQWMTPAYWAILACSTAAVIIPLQYFRRATSQSRRIVVGAVILAPVLSLSTWMPAFSVQQRLSPQGSLAKPIRLAFAEGGTASWSTGGTSGRTLLVPLRVSGLPGDSVLMNDRADVRLAGPDGGTLYRGKTTRTLGYGNDFVVRTTDGGDVSTRQQVVLPEQVYQRLRDRSVRMEIDYSLTVFRLTAAATIGARDGDQRMDGFGRCRTQIDADGDEIELGCLQGGRAPSCVSATLESVTPGRQHSTQWSCAPDYSPYHLQLYPDATSRFTVRVKLPDDAQMSGPGGERSEVAGAYVRVKSYQPAAHFTRRLVVPEIRVLW